MDEVAEMKAAAAELADAARGLGQVTSTSGVHIHGGGLLAVLVASVGILGIVVAVAAVLVVSAWRDADMQELRALATQTDVNNAMISVHERRINKIEAIPK